MEGLDQHKLYVRIIPTFDIKISKRFMKSSHLYNRIADTYFTNKEERTERKAADRKRSVLFISIGISGLVIFLLILFSFNGVFSKTPSVKTHKKSLSVLGNILPLRLDYEFATTSEKIKGITLDLPEIIIADYDMLEFALRGDRQKGFSSLIKIELESRRKEKKSFYLRGIEARWKTFKIPLQQMNTLSSFSELSRISFIVEGWNIDNEQGRILIDKINFSKIGR